MSMTINILIITHHHPHHHHQHNHHVHRHHHHHLHHHHHRIELMCWQSYLTHPDNLRPDPDIVRRNRCFLEMCIGKNNFEKFKHEVDDLTCLDSGRWDTPHIHHHCNGVFCCKNVAETRAKLLNAIIASDLSIGFVLYYLPGATVYFINTDFCFSINQHTIVYV